MPDGQNYNPMQAHMGLLPQTAGPTALYTPSPADTSLRLMEQAQQRVAVSHQSLQATPLLAAQTFGSQFQQRYQQAQGIQSFSPFQAQAMTGGYGGGSSYLPSPLMMTPAQSGVFRPPMPTPIMPIPPMYTPPIIPTPFQPQMPRPMFQSSWDQQAIAQDLQSNRMFSYGMQAPAVAGQAMGIGAAAYMGSRIGGAFGPMGRLAGAIGGGLLASRSGVADTIGDFSQMPFRPLLETRQMGSAVQRMSQDWVVTGAQQHATGRGLTQQAGIGLAGGIKDLSADSGFREQTGGMFNRQDLMRMTQMSGQAGLMDMAQSVPAIQQQLKQVAITVKRFMELTNDPDVTNVIREMGQMRQFGMTMPQINQAAENMRLFSRGAGTSIQGMREMGGMPGAAVYQGMGLTAGQGFDYGNYSLMMARQTVAGGAVNPRQLALMGGVQGMAQRNMQAQAAFATTPLFAAANAQYGAGGWGAGLNPEGMGGGQGAFGMVGGAIQNLNAAVRRGGVGALVSFGMQQQEIADEALSHMTPMEQTAQRFRMAGDTGRQLLRGGNKLDQFSLGAQLLYGPEVANQMTMQARDPSMWASQKRMFDQQRQELALEQRRQREAEYSVVGHFTAPGRQGLSRAGGQLSGGIGKVGGAISDFGTDLWEGLAGPTGYDGTYRLRLGRGRGMSEAAAKQLNVGAIDDFKFGYEKSSGIGIHARGVESTLKDYGRLAEGMALQGGKYHRATETMAAIENSLLGVVSSNLVAGYYELGGMGAATNMTVEKQRKVIDKGLDIKRGTIAAVDRAAKYQGDKKEYLAGTGALDKVLKKGDSSSIILDAGKRIAGQAKSYHFFKNKMTEQDFDMAMVQSIAASEGIEFGEAVKIYTKMPQEEIAKLRGLAVGSAQEDPDVGDKISWSAGEFRADRLNNIGDITKDIQDKQETDLEALQTRLGLRTTGLFGTGLGAVDQFGLEGFKDWAKEQGAAKVAVLAASRSRDPKQRAHQMTEAKKVHLAGGGTEDQWKEMVRNINADFNKLDDKTKDFLSGLSGRKMSEVSEWVAGSQKQGLTGAIRNDAFSGKFAAFSKDLDKALQSDAGVGDIDSFLSKITDADLKRMRREGGEAGQLARLAQGAKKGDVSARKQLMGHAATVGGAETTETATDTATGKEAQDLQASSDAAGEMALVAQQFSPAVKDFARAAKMLLDTAQIQDANAKQGRNE